MTTTKAPEALLKRLRDDNRFLLTSHANPDGDAIGSEIGLARLLRSLGKGAVIWNRDEAPTLYRDVRWSIRIFDCTRGRFLLQQSAAHQNDTFQVGRDSLGQVGVDRISNVNCLSLTALSRFLCL